MKVLLVNTYDTGGAANACLRLHQGLLRIGCNSKVLLMRKSKILPYTFQISIRTKKRDYWARVRNKLSCLGLKFKSSKQKILERLNRPPNLEMISLPFSDYDITKSDLYQEANIINLHWVAEFLDYPTFFKQNTKPLVWTFHDQNAFLGLEHYKEEFVGIDRAGYPIMRKIAKSELKIYEHFLKVKEKAYQYLQNVPYKIVTPSNWLKQETIKSGLFKKNNVVHISYGIDSDLFKPIDKILARELLNLPKKKIIFLFVADNVNNFRKGFLFLYKAIEKLNYDSVLFLSVGRNTISNSKNIKNYIHLGFIHDELLMSIIYSAADAFVIPSLIDNLPNTAIESLMCGTPVIGFPTGGIKEIIKNEINGLLADEISVNALYEKILHFLEVRDTFEVNRIRNLALTQYDLRLQAESYLKIFQSLV